MLPFRVGWRWWVMEEAETETEEGRANGRTGWILGFSLMVEETLFFSRE